MKLLQVSDIHGSVEAANRVADMASKGFDAVFAVGDITHFGNTAQAEDILGRIGRAGVPVYFVAGNCDPEILLTWRPSLKNVFNLHLARARLGGLELLGIGGGNTSPFNTLIEFTEEQFRKMLTSLNPSDRAILLTHTPPYGTAADFTRGRHLGSSAIREFVERARPLAVCCGHIHEGRAVDSIGPTRVVNAGPARDGYCASLIIRHNTVEASLLRL
jgi:Icc-related predicted phosphoesterase